MALLKVIVRNSQPKLNLNLLVPCRQKSLTSGDENYEFIQRSKVPTFHFQPSLPRLPIPELEKTCERYLAAQKPLLSDVDLEKTKGYVEKFMKTDGKSLHEELKNIDSKNKHTSYISEPWFDMYLRDRVPLPINYNPLMVFVNNDDAKYNNQTIRAANMLISSLRFMKSLKNEILEPEVFHLNPKKSDTEFFRTFTRILPSSISWYGAYFLKAYPLDMSQYTSLFNSTRIPEITKDYLFRNSSARHVLVMKGGNMYIFDAIDENGNILPPEDILACLKYIMDSQCSSAQYPLGVLTSENRDTWAKARKHLEEIGNADTLKLIDSSIFNLVLDDETIGDDRIKMIKTFLHGDGTNRWFDKSVSLLIAKDGIAGVNFEHSWGDGVAVLRYFQDIFNDSSKKPWVHPNTQPSNCSPDKLVRKLDFNLDEKAKASITEAKENYNNFCNSLAVNFFEFPGFGKKVCKEYKVSPDSIMQLGFQLAFYKLTGSCVATYESCSTAAFKHGRTETVRPCTTATKAFCEAVGGSKSANASDLKKLIDKCSEVHGNLTKEAAMGQGFDRHLFALRKLAEQHNISPEIFSDKAYAAINYNVLSTSTLSSPAVMGGGFGPVVKDGFGIGYGIQDNALGCVVSTYPPHRNGSDFVQCLKVSFEDIYNILLKSKK